MTLSASAATTASQAMPKTAHTDRRTRVRSTIGAAIAASSTGNPAASGAH